MRVGVSSYSYWHSHGDPYPMSKVLEDAARCGAAGVEVLEQQLGETSTRVKDILTRRGYNGYVSLEMEGRLDPQQAVPQALAMLQSIIC